MLCYNSFWRAARENGRPKPLSHEISLKILWYSVGKFTQSFNLHVRFKLCSKNLSGPQRQWPTYMGLQTVLWEKQVVLTIPVLFLFVFFQYFLFIVFNSGSFLLKWMEFFKCDHIFSLSAVANVFCFYIYSTCPASKVLVVTIFYLKLQSWYW